MLYTMLSLVGSIQVAHTTHEHVIHVPSRAALCGWCFEAMDVAQFGQMLGTLPDRLAPIGGGGARVPRVKNGHYTYGQRGS